MASYDGGHCERGMESHSDDYVHDDVAKTCGVCMDVVLSKQPASKRLFAILPNCNHCFCVECIRTWRKQSHVFANGVTKGCPVCRTVSLYYVPSDRWIEDQAEKHTVCLSHKRVMAEIPCKYFFGSGCVFGPKCFYKHSTSSSDYFPGRSPWNKSRSTWAPINSTRLNGAFMQQGLWPSFDMALSIHIHTPCRVCVSFPLPSAYSLFLIL